MAQHDMNIADAPGVTFLADLNDALAAILSQNSGATEPATTGAYMWWADTTAGLLKQRNAANSAWVTICRLSDWALASVQTQASTRFTAGGTADAMTGTLAPALASYAAGLRVTTTPGGANTVTGPTMNLNSLGAKTIKKRDSGGSKVALAAGDYNASGPFDFEYDGTDFILLNPSTWASNTRGADIASAATINLTTATGDIVDVTGTTSITAITLADGLERKVRFTGALTLTNGASLVLPGGANITTAAGDFAVFRGYAAGVVRCVSYTRANGQAVAGSGGITLGTSVASTSGTSIDFTGIPATAKRIHVTFTGVSTNGTSVPIIQLGDSGGAETSGYAGASGSLGAASSFSNGLALTDGIAAAGNLNGFATFVLQDAATNKWCGHCVMARGDSANVSIGATSKSTSATLDRVRVTTAGGADTFDAGTINITYE